MTMAAVVPELSLLPPLLELVWLLEGATVGDVTFTVEGDFVRADAEGFSVTGDFAGALDTGASVVGDDVEGATVGLGVSPFLVGDDVLGGLVGCTFGTSVLLGVGLELVVAVVVFTRVSQIVSISQHPRFSAFFAFRNFADRIASKYAYSSSSNCSWTEA